MSVDDSYTTLIRKIYEATDKVAPHKKIVLHLRKNCMKNGCVNPYYRVVKVQKIIY